MTLDKKPYDIILSGSIYNSNNRFGDGDYNYYVSTTKEAEEILGQHIFGYGSTPEEATKEFWKTVKIILDYDKRRAELGNKWIPFEKGDWSRMGGTWFKVFGINFYFRYGYGMQHGFYIPGTKLNIMITSYWKKRKK